MRRVVRAGLLLGAVAALPGRVQAHPLHTSFTDVRHDAARAVVQLTVRVFADDFRVAAAHFARASSPRPRAADDSVLARYARARLRLIDARGRPVTLAWGGVRDEGETLAITLVATGVRSVAGVRVGNALLLESFADQVNIVRTMSGTRRRSLLFTVRDATALKSLAA